MSKSERTVLYALLISITAFSLDALLPLLPQMARDLSNASDNRIFFVITAVIFGMIFGEIIFGPIADAIGRKPALTVGLGVFTVGTVIALQANSLEWMLIGRTIQGVGVSGPKIVTRALIRDQFQGPDMARVMSIIFSVFICVPMIAPIFGYWLGDTFGWRSVFLFYLVLAFTAGTWLLLRQPETLPPQNRMPLSVQRSIGNLALIVTNGRVLCYATIAGLVFGTLLTFLSVAQSIFDQTYDRGVTFAYWIAFLSLGSGLSSLLNSRLVMRLPMDTLVERALVGLSLAGVILFVTTVSFSGHPPFAVFVGAMGLVFVSIGTVFGNINAMAMTYLGRIAGMGASAISSLSSLISFVVAALVSQIHDGTPLAMSICLIFSGTLAILILRFTRRLQEVTV